MQEILLSWTPYGGVEFFFVDPYDPSEIDPGTVEHVIPSSETPGDGEFQSDSHLSPRTFSLKGTLVGPNLGTVQGYLNTLLATHPKGGVGKLRQQLIDDEEGVISDYFIECRTSQRYPAPQDGLNRREWKITYKSGNPYWQEWTQRTQILVSDDLEDTGSGASTTADWTPGGGESVLPVFTIVVTTPGTITITPSALSTLDSATSITIDADVADTWTIDCNSGNVTRAGDAGTNYNDAIVSGGKFEVPTTENTLTFAVAGGAAVSSIAVAWRQRFSTI